MVFGDLSPGALNAIMIDRSGTAVSDGLGQHHLCDRQRVEESFPAQSWFHDSTGRGGRQPKPPPATQGKEHPGHPGGWVLGGGPSLYPTHSLFLCICLLLFLFICLCICLCICLGFFRFPNNPLGLFRHFRPSFFDFGGRKWPEGCRRGAGRDVRGPHPPASQPPFPM